MRHIHTAAAAAVLCMMFSAPGIYAQSLNNSIPRNLSAPEHEMQKKQLEIQIPQNNDQIERFRSEYLTSFGKQWLTAALHSAAPYRQYIRRKIRERNMPSCLEYLPIIESSFNPKAVSRSGAAGLWQFMENSIAPFLIKNEWVDERYDPWKSTDAALAKLTDNYKALGSWELAVAAYNYGLGGISRLLKSTGTKDFWSLAQTGKLREQTALYVPKFLAVADLLTNSAYYGISVPDSSVHDYFDFTEIIISVQTDFETLARQTGIEREILEFLNPSLVRGSTPPYESFVLRVPAGAEPLFSHLTEKNLSLQHMYHTVQPGDTLWNISRRYNISVDQLRRANNLSDKDILYTGIRLQVPIIEPEF